MQYKKLKLAINRGNRMVYLVSMASKACGLEEHVEVKKLYEKDLTLKGSDFSTITLVRSAYADAYVLIGFT